MEMLQTKLVRTSVDYWSFIVAALLVAFYLATSVHIASHYLLWYDEINTVLIARLPDWATIWKVLAAPVDAMPPSYYIVVREFDKLFGHSEAAVRLPSALAVMAGLLLAFDCARRLTDGLHGLVALSLLTCSFLPSYAYEARPYALYFMVAALSLWVWTRTRYENKSSAVLIAGVFFLGIMVHYYAVLCLVPYAVWEFWHWKPWRLPSPKMIGALLGVICAAAVLYRQIWALRVLSAHSPVKPSLWSLSVTFSEFFPDGLFLLALIMVWIALVGTKDRIIPLPPMQSGERIGWFFFFIPLAGYVLAREGTNALQSRYLISTLPGIAVAFSCWLWRHFRETWRVSAGILVLLAISGAAKQVLVTRHPERADRFGNDTVIKQVLSVEDALRRDRKQFMVSQDIGLYLGALLYSRHPEQYSLLVFPDEYKANAIILAKNMARYYPLEIWTPEDLQRHARETALIVVFPSTLDTLKRAGFQTRLRFTKPLEFGLSLQVVYLE